MAETNRCFEYRTLPAQVHGQEHFWKSYNGQLCRALSTPLPQEQWW